MGLVFAVLVHNIFAAGEYAYYSYLAPQSLIMSIAAMYGAWVFLKYFRTALSDESCQYSSDENS